MVGEAVSTLGWFVDFGVEEQERAASGSGTVDAFEILLQVRGTGLPYWLQTPQGLLLNCLTAQGILIVQINKGYLFSHRAPIPIVDGCL